MTILKNNNLPSCGQRYERENQEKEDEYNAGIDPIFENCKSKIDKISPKSVITSISPVEYQERVNNLYKAIFVEGKTKKPIKRGCSNKECFCTGKCQEIIGYE